MVTFIVEVNESDMKDLKGVLEQMMEEELSNEEVIKQLFYLEGNYVCVDARAKVEVKQQGAIS